MASQSINSREFSVPSPPLEGEKARKKVETKPSESKSPEIEDLSAISIDEMQKASTSKAEEGVRERLKRHRREIAGRVWIPEIWGQEELLKDWIDCSAFDASLFPSGIGSARAALVEEGRRATSGGGLRVVNRC